MIQTRCRHFNGYKPCGKNEICSESCSSKELVEGSVLIVHLGALGAVVRTTALLELIRKKHPGHLMTWVTDKPADQILRNHPLIDRVLTTSHDDLLGLKALNFQAAYVIDKSLKASGILAMTQARAVYGFKSNPMTGAIEPVDSAGEELWQIGLSNQKKFFENKKSETQLVLEALQLSGNNGPSRVLVPEYNLPLSLAEAGLRDKRAQQWRIHPEQPIIGINTGCSAVIPAKKLSIAFQRQVIQSLLDLGFENLVLLGGPEDTARNFEIGQGLAVFQSPTEVGLRDGLVSVAACDLVLTGDSLGMHMAISQKKFVTAWFGPTCAHEIELYGRGVAILSKAGCAPCWKRTCDKAQMCYDQVALEEIIQALQQGNSWWLQQRKSFLSKQPS
jgi:heptosyltransferase II